MSIARLSAGSVSLDDASFFPQLETVLKANNLIDPLRNECRSSEDTFRRNWRYLESRDCSAPIAAEVISLLSTALTSKVSHVHAFHGCRVSEDSSYETDGIIPLSQEWITREIERLSGSLPAPNSEAGALLEGYLRQYGGIVCAVKSLQFYQETGGYHHALGSETLRNILQRHSPAAFEQLASMGQPSIIEFKILIDILEDNTWPNFVSDMLRIWLARQVPFDRPRDPREGGILLHRTVHPALLVRRYECDETGRVTGNIHTYDSARI